MKYKKWIDVDGVTLHVNRFDDGKVTLYTVREGIVILKTDQVEELIEHLKGESE